MLELQIQNITVNIIIDTSITVIDNKKIAQTNILIETNVKVIDQRNIKINIVIETSVTLLMQNILK